MAQARVSQGTFCMACPPVTRSTPAIMPEMANAGPEIVIMASSKWLTDDFKLNCITHSPALQVRGILKNAVTKVGQASQAISRALPVSFGTPVLRLGHGCLTPNQPNLHQPPLLRSTLA